MTYDRGKYLRQKARRLEARGEGPWCPSCGEQVRRVDLCGFCREGRGEILTEPVDETPERTAAENRHLVTTGIGGPAIGRFTQ